MIESIVLIFVASTILGSIALFLRQPLIVVYVAVGCLLGPFALAWLPDVQVVENVGEIGIIFLLFLIGLELPPNKIRTILGTTLITAIASSLLFFGVGFGAGQFFGFTQIESVVCGIAMMFSSTVLGVKLLPRTVLHHRHIGEIVIGLLLLQDIVAIAAIFYLDSYIGRAEGLNWWLIIGGIPALLLIAYLGTKFLIWPLLSRFDVFTEYTFLLFIGWCLLVAGLANMLGLSLALGAFVAGVALANSPATQGVAHTLAPLRDFFLVLFFVSIGAQINPQIVLDVAWQAISLAVVLVALKPVVFRWLLKWQGEHRRIGWEVGIRLGQCSEFSLLVLFIVATTISQEAMLTILGATVLSMVISTYFVVFSYKNPIAPSERLRVE